MATKTNLLVETSPISPLAAGRVDFIRLSVRLVSRQGDPPDEPDWNTILEREEEAEGQPGGAQRGLQPPERSARRHRSATNRFLFCIRLPIVTGSVCSSLRSEAIVLAFERTRNQLRAP